MGSKAKRKLTSARKPTMAETADRHALYESSVQDTDFEYEFIDETFKALRGRRAKSLREDFCGTANMCCEWVRRRRSNTAIGVDLDNDVLAWGRSHHVAALSAGQRARVMLLQENVLHVQAHPVDVAIAMNFSYQIFKDRATLREYFQRVRDGLVDDGVFLIDAFGGYDAFRELKERTKHEGFTYIWEQASYNPITGDNVCHIHFKFPDGSRLKKAFTYEWRLWTLPELQEVMYEAGFKKVTVYWQGTDEETGEADGVFVPATEGDADPAWICFLAAEK